MLQLPALKSTLSMENIISTFLCCSNVVNTKIFRVDSSEIAFLVTGQGCMDQVLKDADKSIIEPIMNVEVTFPNEFEQRVNMLLLERHVEVESTETDFLVRLKSDFIVTIDRF